MSSGSQKIHIYSFPPDVFEAFSNLLVLTVTERFPYFHELSCPSIWKQGFMFFGLVWGGECSAMPCRQRAFFFLRGGPVGGHVFLFTNRSFS